MFSCFKPEDWSAYPAARVRKYLQKNGGNLGGNSDKIMQGANFVRYQQSKLANVVFTYALHKRLQDCGSKVKALVAHPGVAPTQLSVGTMSAGGASDLERIPAWATKLFFKLKQLGSPGVCP